jgi:hypothetical protein
MKLYVYAPAQAIVDHPDLLSRLNERYDLGGVIIRSAEPKAFEVVLQHGLQALWLAPGLWGHVRFERTQQAEFAAVPAWDKEQYPAYERQFPMYCPNTPGLAEENGRLYAETAQALRATGIFGTHLRYHHPADIEHLWGCVCAHCRASADIDFDLIPQFWADLRRALQKLPVEQWASIRTDYAGEHPLIEWWAAVTQREFPRQWFNWKDHCIGSYLARLRASFETHWSGHVFATNCFEPLLGPLVGNSPDTQPSSDWYAPLLGYWTHHVHESLNNMAAWHQGLAGKATHKDVFGAIAGLVGLDQALENAAIGIEQQLRMGAANAAQIGRDYYPVLNGTITNQYGGTADQFALSSGVELASELGASGIIAQGISQLLDDPTLDFWY